MSVSFYIGFNSYIVFFILRKLRNSSTSFEINNQFFFWHSGNFDWSTVHWEEGEVDEYCYL